MRFGYGSSANEGKNGDSKDWMFSDRCFPCLGLSSLPPFAVPMHIRYRKSWETWEALGNRGYRQSRPGMLSSVGLAKGV